MDVLAYIASDPTVLPLWAAFLFAVGMYPIGLIFGCSPCCQPCNVCQNGDLPETITVTLDGFTDESPSGPLYRVDFAACFGANAAAHPSAPGGDFPDDAGPISAIDLTSGGSGYAVFGREQPTVSVEIDGNPTEPASTSVTLSKKADGCGRDYWEVSGVTVADGGEGYEDGAFVSFNTDDTGEEFAGGYITTTPVAPSVTLGVTSESGAGADLSAVLQEIAGSNPKRWRISSVTVANGGDDYRHGDYVTVTPATGRDKIFLAAGILITVDASEPSVEAEVLFSSGSGAVLTPTLQATTNANGQPVWAVSEISIDQPGDGYAVFDTISVTTPDGFEEGGVFAFVSEVGENGEILAIELIGGGSYYIPGPIVSATVEYSGEFWRDSGAVASVIIQNKGVFYRENPALPPYVASVTAAVVDDGASAYGPVGTGAQVSAVIDSDTSSGTFGQITAVTITNGGSGYLAWKWQSNDCCGHYLNGQTITLARNPQSNGPCTGSIALNADGEIAIVPVSCVYTHRFCGGWQSPFYSRPWIHRNATVSQLELRVGFMGEGKLAVAQLGGPSCGAVSSDDYPWTTCGTGWQSDEPIEKCSEFEWSATNSLGRSISVSPGGSYDPEWRCPGCATSPRPAGSVTACNVCCQGDEQLPDEIEVTWEDQWSFPITPGYPFDPGVFRPWPNVSGTYVMALDPFNPNGGIQWVVNTNNFGLVVALSPGHCGCNIPTDVNTVDYELCCEQCIKKCILELRFMTLGTFWNTYSASQILFDSRIAGDPPHFWITDRETYCPVCEDTPICRPTSGASMPIGAYWNISAGAPEVIGTAGTLTFQ